MKVYAVTYQSNYEDFCVERLFPSQELAQAYINTQSVQLTCYYDIEEFTLDESD